MTGHGDSGHSDIHRQIAAALKELVPDDPAIAPHPYLRRHLAEHAARGSVLDDEHVPPALLPWESSRDVQRLLASVENSHGDSGWLQTWARLEPFAHRADPVSRIASLRVAHSLSAVRPASVTAGHIFGDSPVTMEWSDRPSQPRAWAVTRHPVVSMSAVENFRGESRLVAGDDSGQLHVLDRDGRPAYAPLALHDGAIQHLLAVSGGLVISGGTDGAVHVTDVPHGRKMAEIVSRRAGTWVTSLAVYHPSGYPAVIVAAFSDGHLVALDIGRLHECVVALPVDLACGPLLAALPASSELDWLLYTQDNQALCFDGASSMLVAQAEAKIRALVPMAGYDAFVIGDESGAVSVHSLGDARVTERTVSHPSPVVALTTTQVEGRDVLVSADAQGALRLWSLPLLKPVGRPLPAHTTPISAQALLTVRRNNGRLITAGADCTLRSWPLTKEVFDQAPPERDLVTASALSARSPHFLATARGSNVTVRNIAATDPESLLVQDVEVTALAWSSAQGAQRLVVALKDNRILLLDPTSPQSENNPITELAGHDLPALALVSLSDCRADLLASAGGDGKVCLWDLRSGDLIVSFTDHRFSVRCLASTSFQQDLLVASGGSDGNIRVWDVHGRAQRGPTIRCEQYIVNDLAFVPGPNRELTIASAGQDGSLKLWSAETGQQLGHFGADDGELSAVTALRLGPDRHVLAAAGRTAIHLWDASATSRKLLQIVTGKTARSLRTVADHSSGHASLLLATGEEGTSVFRLHLDRL